MPMPEFVDYYEILEISPNANSATIERIFRYLAAYYHPDNRETGDRDRFDAILEAHNTLKDPARRAQYDIEHKNRSAARGHLAAAAKVGPGQDTDIQRTVLSLLYAKCRQNIREPGIGDTELEQLSGCPAELLEFHLWYLKEKGWIRKTENGTFAITVEGIDRAQVTDYRRPVNMLTDRRETN